MIPLMFAGKNYGFFVLMMLNKNCLLMVFNLPSGPVKSGKNSLNSGSLSASLRRFVTVNSIIFGTLTMLTWSLVRHFE